MIGLCRKEIFHNRNFLLSLSIVNILYFGIHLLPQESFDDVLWRGETFYIILWGVLMPIILYARYGDSNRQITVNVVYTKLRQKQIHSYRFYYFLWLLIGVAAAGGATQLLCILGSDDNVQRGWLFIGNAVLVTIIYILLFLVMISLTHKYLWAVVFYLLAFFGLILFRAPESILWFIYNEGNPMYGIRDKVILIVILFFIGVFFKTFLKIKNNIFISRSGQPG